MTTTSYVWTLILCPIPFPILRSFFWVGVLLDIFIHGGRNFITAAQSRGEAVLVLSFKSRRFLETPAGRNSTHAALSMANLGSEACMVSAPALSHDADYLVGSAETSQVTRIEARIVRVWPCNGSSVDFISLVKTYELHSIREFCGIKLVLLANQESNSRIGALERMNFLKAI
jgi:hypothetical protein